MVRNDGSEVSADHYQPTSARIENIGDQAISKSTQAEVVIQLGGGSTARMGEVEARAIANHILTTPGHRITRVVVVRDGTIIVDAR